MFLTLLQKDQYRARGLAAYYRSGGGKQPQHTTFATYRDRSYLYFHSDDFENEGIQAVYRIDNSGRLKRLKRWPSDADRKKWSDDEVWRVCQRAAENLNSAKEPRLGKAA
jgi:hypothetical protein